MRFPVWALPLASLSDALHISQLNAGPWTLSNANQSIHVAETNIPNTHMTLMQAGILQGDPHHRDNELRWGWVALDTWKYQTAFTTTEDMISHDGHFLQCQIDTVASINLNGHAIGDTSNMFLNYEFDVSEFLSGEGEANMLEVTIHPALEYAARKAKEYPYAIPESVYYHTWVEGSQPDTEGWGNGTYTHRNFIRKIASDFGWDWGPAFVPSGITNVAIVSRRSATLEALTVHQDHSEDGSVTLYIEAHLDAAAEAAATLTVSAFSPLQGVGGSVSTTASVQVAAGERHAQAKLTITNPMLWWPVGSGEQHLYDVQLSLSGAGDESTLQRRVGLRTVELVQEERPGGLSFLFRVNGVDVYAKGSNFIPADVFQPRAEEELEWILRSAVDANMNMVRVWGGGMYQVKKFYDLADELGLMVWQEMMFACALYPRDIDFLATITEEITQQARRLQHHASVVIWGGNNENEVAMEWYAASRASRDLYVSDYMKLYIDTAYAALRNVDSGVNFIDTSPSNGVLSIEPYAKRWGQSLPGGVGSINYGDAHYYNYGADCEDHTTYPKSRFVSEHGFQSFPSFLEYESVLSEDDWSHNSTELFRRQRHPEGQEQMLAMLKRHFRVPPEIATEGVTQQKVFDDYLYLTQVQQSRCYETAFSQWRRLRSDPDVNTMGILYWQLNDIWPGPSWSTMEHSGAWRLTHNAVQRSFAPVLPSMTVEDGKLQVFLTSDFTAALDAKLRVALRRWDASSDASDSVVGECTVSVKGETKMCSEFELKSALQAAGCSESTCFAYLTGTASQHGSSSPLNLATHAALTPLKDAELPEVTLSVSQPKKHADGKASVVVTASATAVYATIESSAVIGRFTPNAMLMLPGVPVEVHFTGRTDFDLADWQQGLKLRSLRDTYSATVKDQRTPTLV